ncbi:MAG: hypothetical protein ABSG57_12940 [Candidatus Bathyarchaeia archaeon]
MAKTRKTSFITELNTLLFGEKVTQPPPPPSEAKKPNPWKILTVILLVGIIGMGTVIGILWSGQTKQSGYTRVFVFSDDVAYATLNNYSYTFLYKWGGYNAYDPQKPIEIDVAGLSQTLPATQGQTYNVLGIEVVVSQVYNDYVILLVKPLPFAGIP